MGVEVVGEEPGNAAVVGEEEEVIVWWDYQFPLLCSCDGHT